MIYKWMITKMLTREIGITFFVTIKERGARDRDIMHLI
jgi:hypothetical protein